MAELYTSGQRIVLKARKHMKEPELLGYFQAMHSKARAVVFVEPTAADDDGVRIVDVRSIRPYYNHPSDQKRRAKHAARLYKQGIRMFRLEKPDGPTFNVETIDVEKQVAVGRKLKRKTVQIVALHDLWPEQHKC